MALYYSSTKTNAVLNVWTVNDDTIFFVNNQTGTTFLETTFTPYASNSKFLIMATVNGAAGDDASGVLQRFTSGSWSEPDSLRGSAGSSSGFRGTFGDWSVTRGVEDKQTLQFTAVFVDQPNAAGTIGYRVRVAAENVNGLWVNRSTGTDGQFNTNSSRSTIVVFELGQ